MRLLTLLAPTPGYLKTSQWQSHRRKDEFTFIIRSYATQCCQNFGSNYIKSLLCTHHSLQVHGNSIDEFSWVADDQRKMQLIQLQSSRERDLIFSKLCSLCLSLYNNKNWQVNYIIIYSGKREHCCSQLFGRPDMGFTPSPLNRYRQNNHSTHCRST